MEIHDLDSYRQPNDIGPDDPAPREPEGPPDGTNEEFSVWMFDSETSETVPDIYVVARNPEPLDFRMWVFVGKGEKARLTMRASHKYGPDEEVPGGREDCCEVLFDGQSLTAAHCPEPVETLVRELTAAAIEYPETGGGDNPIRY